MSVKSEISNAILELVVAFVAVCIGVLGLAFVVMILFSPDPGMLALMFPFGCAWIGLASYLLYWISNRGKKRLAMEQSQTQISKPAQISKPDKLSKAVMLLYITLGIGVLRDIMEVSHVESTGFAIFMSIHILGITWFFIYKIGKGRNWARIIFLVLFIVGISISVTPLLQSLASNPFSGVLGIVQIVLRVIALVFLFQKPSSEWFKQMKGRPF